MQRYSWYMAGAIKSSCVTWGTKNYWSLVRWELDEVSLKKPNKRFAVSHEDRIQRSLEYFKMFVGWSIFLTKTSTQSQKYTMRTRRHYTQMNPLCKRLSFTGHNTFVKENYMLSRERVTAFTQVLLEEHYLLPPEFVLYVLPFCLNVASIPFLSRICIGK